VAEDNGAFSQSFCPRGANAILIEHFEKRRSAKLDFPQSGDVTEGIGQAFHENARHFHHFRLRTRQTKSLTGPDLPSYPRQGVGECRGAFAIPRSLPDVLRGIGQGRMGTTIAALPNEEWQRLSGGDGSKGPRVYDGAAIRLPFDLPAGGGQGVLARRSLSEPGEIAYYRVFAPTHTPVAILAQVAGTRWTIETGFARAKGEVGLDEGEVRRWEAWHRHITLALLADAYLAVTRLHAVGAEKKGAVQTC